MNNFTDSDYLTLQKYNDQEIKEESQESSWESHNLTSNSHIDSSSEETEVANEILSSNSECSSFPSLQFSAVKPNKSDWSKRSFSKPEAYSTSSKSDLCDTKELKSSTLDSPAIYVLLRKKSMKVEDKNFVSENLINQWNEEVGNTDNQEKAHKRILYMRKLGGIDLSDSKTDIPSALMGLCLLAGLNDQENKMFALNSLLEIFRKSNYKKSESSQLVKLTIKLLDLMNREDIQALNLDAQNKIAEVYNTVIETLLIHYGKKHINAITKELKLQFVATGVALKKLNRLEDKKLKYNINCAIEGMRRFKDDRQELFELIERVYNAAKSAICIYKDEPQEGLVYLEKAFKDLDPHLPTTWFDAVLILKRLAKNVDEDPSQLTPLLLLIGKKYQELDNWKFTYAAVEVLFNLARHGKTKEIRHLALNGAKNLGADYPGMALFAESEILEHYRSLGPLIHLKPSEKIDPNVRIRKVSIEHLIELIEKSDDEAIVSDAKKILIKCSRKEKDAEILALIENCLGTSKKHKISPDLEFFNPDKKPRKEKSRKT